MQGKINNSSKAEVKDPKYPLHYLFPPVKNVRESNGFTTYLLKSAITWLSYIATDEILYHTAFLSFRVLN